MKPAALLFGILVSALCAHAQNGTKVEIPPTKSYFVYSAGTPDEETGKMPLIIWHHGSGDTADNFFGVTQADPGRTRAVICVIHSINRSGWSAADDKSVEEVLRWAKSKFPIDERNIWQCGFSAGGFYTCGYALTHQEVFKGMAVCGAGAGQRGNPSDCRIAPYVLVGDQDPNLGPSRALADALRKANAPFLKYDEVKGMGHTIGPDNVRNIYLWMWEVMAKTAPKPAPVKSTRLRFTVSVGADVSHADLDALSKKVQEASDLVWRLSGGLAWIEKATVRDQNSTGEVVVDLPAGGDRVELKKRKTLRATAQVGADDIAFAVMHLGLGLEPMEDKECLLDLKKLIAGKPVQQLCPESQAALKKKLPEFRADRPAKGQPPAVEIKIQDK